MFLRQIIRITQETCTFEFCFDFIDSDGRPIMVNILDQSGAPLMQETLTDPGAQYCFTLDATAGLTALQFQILALQGGTFTLDNLQLTATCTQGVQVANVKSTQDYYPFGMVMPGRNFNSNSYNYGFGGHLKDDEFKGDGNSYDMGARLYDPRIGRTPTIDPMAYEYPGTSPYAYVLNTPISAIDPDGRLVMFIGGLRLWHAHADQEQALGGGRIHQTDVYDYWSSGSNTFGREADIAGYFQDAIGDHNAYFTSGSSHWNSQANQRFDEGRAKAQTFHAMVQSGEIELADDETIKIVSHSQGGAHAAGYAQELMSYTDADGNPLYKVEVIYYITPHQPTDITTPAGVRSVQYSHPGDAVSSDAPWWLINGGSEFGPINGIDEFYGDDIMGGEGQPECEGASGNRCGHNVTDNDNYIEESGSVKPRQDSP